MPKTDNKKDEILKAALTLFAEQGFASTPISLIAKKAKVSQGLMYNFFRSKNELLHELIKFGAIDIAASMESYITEKDPRVAIRKHILKTIEIVQKNKKVWRLLHAIRLQGLVIREVESDFRNITMQVTSTFEKVFRQLKFPNPKLEAILFLSQIDGIVILYLQDPQTPIKKLGQQLINRYVK